MSDAVHRIARRHLARGLATATAMLGFTGVGLALAMSGGAAANASAAHQSTVATGVVTVHTSGTKQNWPYFACASVGDWGVCVGPPTN